MTSLNMILNKSLSDPGVDPFVNSRIWKKEHDTNGVLKMVYFTWRVVNYTSRTLTQLLTNMKIA